MTSIRALIAIVAAQQWSLYHLDVKNTFLHGDLHEEVYMQPPPGLPHLSGQSEADHAMFVHTSSRGHTILLLYVDDMVITGIAYGPRGYLLSQQKYISDLLARAELTGDQIADTPIQLHKKLAPDTGELLENPTRYREIVGALVYLTISRPDIAFVVHVVSQFVQSPTSIHYVAVLRILRYLRDTSSRALLFSSTSNLQLRAFTDSNWAGDIRDRRSITGFCVFLGDTLISW
ncbi:uncharacterized protein LOC109825431 [Asparagus officinalis]|uniref:uncharacterized protein LOC109825431 n=1 Tax=Asparagus officinalis TaxID=4686 RepID=UPI00098E06D0|nr:uncharacterized protein LOC109825431 [Asparagus officinalis]